MKMFKADITINFEDGSTGAKVIYASSMDQVMDDACNFVRRRVLEGRELNNQVVEHKVIGGEAPEYD